MGIRFLSLLSLGIALAVHAGLAGDMNAKLSPALRLLRAAHLSGTAPQFIQSEADRGDIRVSVRLAEPSDPAVWEGRGMRLRKMAGRYSGSGSVYGARMTWSEIEQWANDPDVLMIASDWQPRIVPCLDVSAPEVGAPEVWEIMSSQGFPITGEGQLVADFDTGIDVFHPAFFRPTNDLYDWLDIDQNGQLTSGVDVVDLNRNGQGEREEILRLLDGQIYDEAATFGSSPISNADNIYQSDWDWLYADANDNEQRDYGTAALFSENDPAYGEPVFQLEDTNGNHSLDPGEMLNMLGSSKIQAVFDADSVKRRGVDLIEANPDVNGHGTAVCGVLAGGEPWKTRFCGLAPGADLLVCYTYSPYWFEDFLPWVREEGCRILLYEFGNWIFNPLDGSTNEELLLSSEAALGVMQVTPSGNLNRGDKHCQLQLESGQSTDIQVGVAAYQGVDPQWMGITFLWREPSLELSVSLEDPYGYTIDLAGADSIETFGSWNVYSGSWISPRETAEYDISISGISGEPLTGPWMVTVHHPGGTGFELNGYIQDNVSSWEGGAEFDSYISTDKTVTWPATADSAFVLGSYSTRGYEQYVGVGSGSISVGEISKFSGRGTRIDGVHILSLAAPGNYDVYSARSVNGYPYTHGGWRQFSGTSAAGPHVAASAVLARAADTTLTRGEIEGLLESFAISDSFTGPVYNDTWGYGKIRIDELAQYLGVASQGAPEALPTTLSLAAFPNPFNSTVSIRIELPFSDAVELSVYDLMGRRVAELYRGAWAAGSQRLEWNAKDVPSGVYWVRLRNGAQQEAQKMVVLK